MEKPVRMAVLVRKHRIDETLAQPPKQGKRVLEPFKSFAEEEGFPTKILEDTDVRNDAEVHTHEGDLWRCIEGKVTFRYGGELVEPWCKKLADGSVDKREWKAKEIKGGVEATLEPGDELWIPAGVPHQHWATGTARLEITKIPALVHADAPKR